MSLYPYAHFHALGGFLGRFARIADHGEAWPRLRAVIVAEAPWLEAPWLEAPWLEAPWLEAPWLEAPWLEAPWLEAPWLEGASPDHGPGMPSSGLRLRAVILATGRSCASLRAVAGFEPWPREALGGRLAGVWRASGGRLALRKGHSTPQEGARSALAGLALALWQIGASLVTIWPWIGGGAW